MVSISLGAGRIRIGKKLDYSASIEVFKKIGDFVKCGETVAKLYSSKVSDFSKIKKDYISALKINDDKVPSPKLIKKGRVYGVEGSGTFLEERINDN